MKFWKKIDKDIWEYTYKLRTPVVFGFQSAVRRFVWPPVKYGCILRVHFRRRALEN